MVLEKYRNAEGFANTVDALVETVQASTNADIKRALQAEADPISPAARTAANPAASAPPAAAATGVLPARTRSSPDWNGEPVPKLDNMHEFAGVSVNDFDASQKRLSLQLFTKYHSATIRNKQSKTTFES